MITFLGGRLNTTRRLDTQEDDEFASGIQDYLKQMTGARSVPRTFISLFTILSSLLPITDRCGAS